MHILPLELNSGSQAVYQPTSLSAIFQVFSLQSSFLMRVPLFEMLIQFAKVMTKKLASLPYLVTHREKKLRGIIKNLFF